MVEKEKRPGEKEKKSLFSIDKRAVQKSIVRTSYEKADGEKIEYESFQYRITLPPDFVKEHELEDKGEVFLLSDSIGLFLPDEKTLMRVLVLIPELREILHTTDSLTEEEINKILEVFPELMGTIKKQEEKKNNVKVSPNSTSN